MKILCLADNSSTDRWGHLLSFDYAKEKKFKFQGLLEQKDNYNNGVYHVGTMDMDTKNIISIAKKEFDKVIFINQKQNQFSHHRIFLAMWELIKNLRINGVQVEEENSEIFQYLYNWEDVFEKNRNICILPFVEIHNHGIGGLNLCGRSMNHPVIEKEKFSDILEAWVEGKNINNIRKSMLCGQRVDHCKQCHFYEDKNVRDQRWNYSFDWIARLQIKNINDLTKIKNPLHYNLRLSNKCNLMCKMCNSDYSHLLEKESKTIQDPELKEFLKEKVHHYNANFENIDLNKVLSIYITGGEPTFNPLTYDFLQKCIDNKKTNLIINIQTNAAKITPKFFSLTKYFKNLTMNCSVDGVGKINEYQRWLLNSDVQTKNILEFYKQGHHIHIIHVVSIYNISTIGDTMHYFDNMFPFASVQLQWAGFKGDILNPYNHTNKTMIVKSLQKAKQAKCYWHNESGTTEIINNLFSFYNDSTSKPNLKKLQKFFWYNDHLDLMRGSKLIEYIPDLEACRKYL